MPKLMTRLLPISWLLMLVVSCKSYQVSGVQERAIQVQRVENKYFLDTSVDYLYKAHIEVYGNDLSGIFIVKKINDTTHRVVLTTDFGNKLLDFELTETDFKVNAIVEDLNKKMVINTLEKDFRLLLKKEFVVDAMFDNDNVTVYKTSEQNHANYLFFSKENNSLLELKNTSKSKEKVVFKFVPKNVTFAESILIQHYNIQLKIELNQISN